MLYFLFFYFLFLNYGLQNLRNDCGTASVIRELTTIFFLSGSIIRHQFIKFLARCINTMYNTFNTNVNEGQF